MIHKMIVAEVDEVTEKENKEENITIDFSDIKMFDGRKKTEYEDLVPYVNNKFIPQNYLDIYNNGDTGKEKTLTILFD